MGDSVRYNIDLDGLGRFKHDLDKHYAYTPVVNSIKIELDKDLRFDVEFEQSSIQTIIDNRPICIVIRYDNSDLVFNLLNAEETKDGQELTYIFTIPSIDKDESSLLFFSIILSYNSDYNQYDTDSYAGLIELNGGGGTDIDYANENDIEDMFKIPMNYYTYDCYCSNGPDYVMEGSPFETDIVLNQGYDYFENISILMNGVDITSSAWNGGSVYIPNVTGPVTINATAGRYAHTYDVNVSYVDCDGMIDPLYYIPTIQSTDTYNNTFTIRDEYLSSGWTFNDINVYMNGEFYNNYVSYNYERTQAYISGLQPTGDIGITIRLTK